MNQAAAAFRSTVPGRLQLPLLPGPALAGFVVATVAVAVIALFSYNSLRETAELREQVTHDVDVIDTLQTLLATLIDAETGQRGYLITGTESFLEPYAAAQVALPGVLAKARALVAD